MVMRARPTVKDVMRDLALLRRLPPGRPSPRAKPRPVEHRGLTKTGQRGKVTG